MVVKTMRQGLTSLCNLDRELQTQNFLDVLPEGDKRKKIENIGTAEA